MGGRRAGAGVVEAEFDVAATGVGVVAFAVVLDERFVERCGLVVATGDEAVRSVVAGRVTRCCEGAGSAEAIGDGAVCSGGVV